MNTNLMYNLCLLLINPPSINKMIVNPSEFNYRIALGSLIAVVIALAGFGFSNYNSLKSDADFIKQEKKLLQQELSSFISRYDALGAENDSILLQYDFVRKRAESVLDSLDVIKADLELLSNVQQELNYLKRESRKWRVDSLNDRIRNLEKEKVEISNVLDEQNTLSESLRSENRFLTELLESGNKIYANSFEVKALMDNGNGGKEQTFIAKKTDQFEVCFVIGKNPVVSPGTKKIYIQIVGPDNNVINDLGAVEFGNLSLIYSAGLSVDYFNENTEVCAAIPGSEEFETGTYFVSVFENERRLGGTQIELN